MSIETRGVINGLIAAAVSLGIVFGLAAILGPSTHSQGSSSSAPASPAAGSNVTASLVVEGQGFFKMNCAGCHGAQGQGVMGPDIRNEDMTDAQIASTITNGIKPSMPAFGSRLKPDQITDIVAYVRTLKK